MTAGDATSDEVRQLRLRERRSRPARPARGRSSAREATGAVTTAGATRFDTVPAEARPFHGQTAGTHHARQRQRDRPPRRRPSSLSRGYFGVSRCVVPSPRGVVHVPDGQLPDAYAAWFAVLVVYFAWSWALHRPHARRSRVSACGSTRAKSGQPLRGLRAFIRAVLCAAFPLLLLWVAIDGEAAGACRTSSSGRSVVYDWGGSRRRRLRRCGRGGCRRCTARRGRTRRR